MYRTPPPLARPYQIAFSPQAWSHVGGMGAETFKALRSALDRIAQAPEEATEALGEAPPDVRSANVHEWVVLYERDGRARTLTVRNLIRRQLGAAGLGK
jgi:hypothetical protein